MFFRPDLPYSAPYNYRGHPVMTYVVPENYSVTITKKGTDVGKAHKAQKWVTLSLIILLAITAVNGVAVCDAINRVPLCVINLALLGALILSSFNCLAKIETNISPRLLVLCVLTFAIAFVITICGFFPRSPEYPSGMPVFEVGATYLFISPFWYFLMGHFYERSSDMPFTSQDTAQTLPFRQGL